MSIESTSLYREMKRRAVDVPAGPDRLVDEFERLRLILQEHGKYIVQLFPEYTPHDHTRHLDHLFAIADRVLGTALYTRLSPVELILLAFGLYAHDWGMAVSESEKNSLLGSAGSEHFASLVGEPAQAINFISDQKTAGMSDDVAWRDYVRRTHGFRSGARLRKHLAPLGSVFSEAVAKIAEGHTMSLREVRNHIPFALSVFGEIVNVNAIATYVRMIDLLDIGEDRTPYALWKYVSPADSVSSLEWKKHRALSAVAVKQGAAFREVFISGQTDDYAVFASLADLRTWIDEQFVGALAQLRVIGGKYDLDLDSHITWTVEAIGFSPISVRFDLDRREVLGLLSRELYQGDSHAFLRELLQNSVDAIDMREALLAKQNLKFKGEIKVRLSSVNGGLNIEWRDNGVGMDEDILVSYFARPGQCWYRSQEASQMAQIDAISRFGVGVLSFFAVSDTLKVETQIEPYAGKSRPGLIIEIPARESHFRIRTTTGGQVGTAICLAVHPRLCPTISKESVCEAIRRIARFVRHGIRIESDGFSIEAGIAANPAIPDAENVEGNLIGPKLVAIQGDDAKTLDTLASVITFNIGKSGENYCGQYAAVIPKHPMGVRSKVGSSKWVLDGVNVEFDNVLFNSEESLFVKGIQSGLVSGRGKRADRISSEQTAAQYSNWISPKILLNFPRPSGVEFNLSRSSARLMSNEWIDAAWREIASTLRTKAFKWPVKNSADLAAIIGSCALFGAVPDSGLEALTGADECPLLIIRAGQGPVWVTSKEFTSGSEFVEAPFELAYSTKNQHPFEFGKDSGLVGWEGVDCLSQTAYLRIGIHGLNLSLNLESDCCLSVVGLLKKSV